jgi:hypothetical protein
MAFKMTLWLLALTFVAMVYNGVSAYSAMGSVDVQDRFEQIGLIEYSNKNRFVIPPRKPAPPMQEEMVASLD